MTPLKLLVAEDDPASLELMTEVFTSLTANVRAVRDSQHAADRVNQERFDGVFLDLEMPNLHGFDLARIIRRSSWNKSIPIIIVTGRDERETMQQAFTIEANFFLQKPVDRQKLSILFRTVHGGMLENRRRYMRAPIQTEVSCMVGARTIRGVTWNLSQAGIQVEAGGLQPKDKVRVLFQLPVSGVRLEAIGTVVWVKEKQQGIQFANVSSQHEQSIRRFVAEVGEQAAETIENGKLYYLPDPAARGFALTLSSGD
jgi:CheY-like chemotaxis protein